MVEQDLASVKRDVELERTRYMDLKNKHASALLAEDLVAQTGGRTLRRALRRGSALEP